MKTTGSGLLTGVPCKGSKQWPTTVSTEAITALEKAYIATLEKQVRDLREALEPFARAANFADENPLAAFEGIVCDADVLRTARDVMADTATHDPVKPDKCSPADAQAYIDMLIYHNATLVHECVDSEGWVWFVVENASYDYVARQYSGREEYARAKDPYEALELARVVLGKLPREIE